jgi:protein kinase-like protein/PEGA domain-containing protein
MTSVDIPPREFDSLDAAARDDLRGLFELELVHRRGPQSLVCVARDLEYDQPVALEVIPRGPGADAAAEQAFHQAAALVAALDHPNVVPLYSVGATDRFFWCSMQHVEGQSLAEGLRSTGPMELSACLRLAEQVAAALDAAHQLGVVHGNLTPANVLVDAAGDAHVTDFWVPWVLERLGARAGKGNEAREGAYRAPEVSAGRDPGPPADQYALAVLVYQCLSGKAPVLENPLKAIAQGRPIQPPPRLADILGDIPLHVSDAVARALTPAPDGRFSDVLDFVTALRVPAPAPAPGPALVPPPPPAQAPGRGLAPRTRVLVPDDDPADDDAPPRPGFRWGWLPVGVVTLAVLGAVSVPWLFSSGSAGNPTGASGTYFPAPADSLLLHELPPARADSVTPAPRTPIVRAPAPTAPPARPRSAVPPARSRPGATEPRSLGLPGRVFINAMPWGQVYVDGELLGNTPRVNVPISPGAHRLRVVRDGFQPFERAIRIAPGQELRITDIVLQEITP